MAPQGRSRAALANLLLATVAFALCFTAWSLIAPFAKSFKNTLGLDYTEALLLTAIPVVLGSLLRVPLGIATDRYGGRLVFSFLLACSAVPAVLFGYATAYWALLCDGFLLGIAGASFAVGVPFVAGWFPPNGRASPLAFTASGTSGRLAYQVHAALPWLLYMVWPFSRLVHVWSIPLQYLGRPYILYRSRYRARAGTHAG
jgi:NNP family nitrate/nitrite transporter-like MFS transporter